jgi:hypothetical protein
MSTVRRFLALVVPLGIVASLVVFRCASFADRSNVQLATRQTFVMERAAESENTVVSGAADQHSAMHHNHHTGVVPTIDEVSPPSVPSLADEAAPVRVFSPSTFLGTGADSAAVGEVLGRHETMNDPKLLAQSELMADLTANASHYLAPIPPLPDNVYPEAHAIREAFLRYNADPTAVVNVPVYGTACIDTRDCFGVFEQLRRLDTGVGHVVVTLSFPQFNPDFHERLEQFEKLFPGRFTYIRRPDGGSCAEGWNAPLVVGFSIQPRPPFVLIASGDVVPHPGAVAYLASRTAVLADRIHMMRVGQLVLFAMTQKGFEEVGQFDENVFPIYGEDLDWQTRLKRLGGIDHVLDKDPGAMFEHVKRPRDPRIDAVVEARKIRWNNRGVRDTREASRATDDSLPKYMDIRWGPAPAPYTTPYNIPGAPVKWWWKDPILRRCLLSSGDKPCLPDASRMRAAWEDQQRAGP